MSNKLMELSMNQLREKAVASGMATELVQTFSTKTQIIGVIEALEAKAKSVDPSKSGAETPKEKKSSDEAWLSKRARMGRQLEKQPKVGISLPLEVGEKVGVVESRVVNGVREFKVISGSFREKIMNGYKWILPKGVMTQVPKQIYEKLSNEINAMAKLGSEHSIDRIDKRTGAPVRDALSLKTGV